MALQVRHAGGAGDDCRRLDVAEGQPVLADFVVGAFGVNARARERLTSVRPASSGITKVTQDAPA